MAEVKEAVAEADLVRVNGTGDDRGREVGTAVADAEDETVVEIGEVEAVAAIVAIVGADPDPAIVAMTEHGTKRERQTRKRLIKIRSRNRRDSVSEVRVRQRLRKRLRFPVRR